MTVIHQWNASGQRITPAEPDEPDFRRREDLLRTHLANVHGIHTVEGPPYIAHDNLHAAFALTYTLDLPLPPRAHSHAPEWLDMCDDTGSIDCPAGPGEHTEACLDVLQAPLRKAISDEMGKAITDLAREDAHAAVWGDDHDCPGIEAPHEPSGVLTGLLNMKGVHNTVVRGSSFGAVVIEPRGITIGFDPGLEHFCGFKVPHRVHNRPDPALPMCFGVPGS